ncbi:MAG TPA: hypothetical protein VNJ70_00140 [Thermoanaerobaculia bacterium]|nr:hypothetical protein [Thermoanaerobaculia bacterium]
MTLESGKEGTFLTGKLGFTRNIGAEKKLLSLVTFRAPFETKEEVGFLNLDGLTGSTAAALKFTLEHTEIVTRGDGTLAGESLNDICNDVNEEITADFRETRPLLDKVEECTEEGVRASPILEVEFTQRKNNALWAMCEDINKKKGIDLLAPPGEDRATIPGYRATCSVETIVQAREEDVRKAIEKKAAIRLVNKKKSLAELQEEELTKACEEFNKARSEGRIKECSAANLARSAVEEEVTAKNREALVVACQEELVVPDLRLFRTGNSVSNTCLLSSLLDFAFTSRKPAYWYRRTLRSFPVRLWYWTIDGTRTDQTFKFFDPNANFVSKSSGSDSTRYEGSLSLFYRGWFYSVGAGQQKQFKASPSLQVCFPRENSPGALNCVAGALAGPTERDLTFARGEIRTFLRPNVGATLRGIYDTDAAEWELHTILHFLRNPQAGLNGGIDLQYNTAAINRSTPNPRGEHFTVLLFVGSKFNLPFLPNQ